METKKLTPIYDQIFDQDYWYINCKNTKEFLKILTIAGKKDVDVIPDAYGESVILDDGIIAFWADKKNKGLVAHEAMHSVFSSLNGKGMKHSEDSEEAYCRVLQFILNKIYPSGYK